MCHDPLDGCECYLLDTSPLELDFAGYDASQWLNFMRATVPIFFVVVEKSKERL